MEQHKVQRQLQQVMDAHIAQAKVQAQLALVTQQLGRLQEAQNTSQPPVSPQSRSPNKPQSQPS